MKRIIFFTFITLLATAFTACEKDVTTEDVSTLTYYVELQLEGEQEMVIPLGSDYTDPGFTAVERGTEVDDKVNVSGSVDNESVGFYPITYSVKSEDGWSTIKTRNVIVFDPEASAEDLSGTYAGNYAQAYFGQATITKLANGFYAVSDFFAGIYIYDFGYASAYVAKGYMKMNSDDTFVGIGVSSPWGAEEVQNGVFLRESQTFEYNLAGYGSLFQMVKQ
ncbi:MAG: DUF5012 domain-containing protein [Kiritimatiellae bacterium]|jgi:hypothetical protein|nr:DUF5012 domain-containing protein [Kiritimatiellia bacterium]